MRADSRERGAGGTEPAKVDHARFPPSTLGHPGRERRETMEHRYVNTTDSRWPARGTREHGQSSVSPGATFHASDREHARIQRRGQTWLKYLGPVDGAGQEKPVDRPVRPVMPEVAGPKEAAEVRAGPAQEPDESAGKPDTPEEERQEPEEVPDWPLRMPTSRYLKMYPDGPHAPTARAIETALASRMAE